MKRLKKNYRTVNPAENELVSRMFLLFGPEDLPQV